MRILYLDPIKSDKPLLQQHDIITASSDEFKSTFESDYIIAGKVRKLKPLLEKINPKPDVILNGWRAGNNIYSDIHEINIPRIYFAADPHMIKEWGGYYSSAFDAVITTQKDYIEYYKESGVNKVFWCPWWSDVTSEQCEKFIPTTEREYDVSYVGHFNLHFQQHKRDFFTKLKEKLDRLKLKYFIGTKSWFEVYPKSKIGINFCQESEINRRFFEIPSAGALLLTPMIENGINQLAKNNQMAIYEEFNVSDAVAKIQYYLKNHAKRIKIATKGWQNVKNNHLYRNYSDRLLSAIKDVISNTNKPKRSDAGIRFNIAKTLALLAQRPIPVNSTDDQKKEMVDARIYTAIELLQQNKDSRSKKLHTACREILKNFSNDVPTKEYTIETNF
ncbi:MAG: glycosyltransferase family 1 protein [Planctomycetes bacterium]|nr:glycosyltransferase family 1 protein [Planctomycetota bacterium]